MTLSERDRERLADVVRLQPTKNAELMDRWDMDSGSEVHNYLEDTLGEYYYRDENSLIRATAEAAELVDVEPGIEAGEASDDPDVVRVADLEADITRVLAGPEERSESVVSVLQKVREEFDVDPGTDAIRSALGNLRRKGVVETIHRTVPTYRLAVERDEVTIERIDDE